MRGRNSIFRGKADGAWISGLITAEGKRHFEESRDWLTRIYQEILGRKPVSISNADVIEFLARGVAGTKTYLRTLKR